MHTSEGLAVIAGPGIPHGASGRRHDIRDVTATLYSLAGVEAPEHLEGRAIRIG
jgi:hypothetical protein